MPKWGSEIPKKEAVRKFILTLTLHFVHSTHHPIRAKVVYICFYFHQNKCGTHNEINNNKADFIIDLNYKLLIFGNGSC